MRYAGTPLPELPADDVPGAWRGTDGGDAWPAEDWWRGFASDELAVVLDRVRASNLELANSERSLRAAELALTDAGLDRYPSPSLDAAQPDYFRSGKAQNFLDPEHVAAIVGAFRSYEEVERFAHVADLDEIAANDHNLNISRYVDTTEPVEVPSVEEALAQLRKAERRRDEAAARMDEQLAGLGYAQDR